MSKYFLTMSLLISSCMPMFSYDQQELLNAAQKGEQGVVRQIISQEPGLLEVRDIHGNTPLSLAAFYGHIEILKFLIESGAQLDPNDNWQNTPLNLAVWTRKSDAALILIDKGVQVNTQNDKGNTPLHNAIITDQPNVIKALLKAGASHAVKNKDDQYPEDIAIANNRRDLALLLNPQAPMPQGQINKPSWNIFHHPRLALVVGLANVALIAALWKYGKAGGAFLSPRFQFNKFKTT